MVINTPSTLNSDGLALQFENFKMGGLTINEFSIMAISKALGELRLVFINEDLPYDQFDDVASDLSLSILGVLNNNNWESIKNPSAYFTKTASNIIIDLIRKLTVQPLTSSQLDEIAIEDCEIDKIDLMEVLCLSIQDELDSEIISLRVVGYTQKEIATKLGRPLSTINSRLIRLKMRYEQDNKEL